ncbi:MAG: hypothetical protein NTY11_03360 [Candidatus Parcubacteria bacterium]|nr:hypothetical protein [Candidatus Parcubacteria bacterium]
MKNKISKKSYQAREYRHLRKRKSILKNKYFWLAFLAILIAVGFFYFLVFSPVFQLKGVIVKGASFVNPTEVENFIREQSNKNIIFFPTRSIIVFNSKKAEQLILKKFLPIDKVKIRRQFFNKLVVDFLEKEPKAVFCPVGTCFLIDKEGMVFRPIEKESVSPSRAVIIFDGKVNLGDTVISKENLAFIIEVFKFLKQRDVLISEFKISPSKIEGVISDSKLAIYFNPQKNAEQQAQDLILVLENQNSPDSNSKGAKEYIDLRFDKIFLK